jgi:hypothetical protein
MTLFIDKTINLCKWPIALLALFSLRPAAIGFTKMILIVIDDSNRLGAFLLGFVLYLILWHYIFRLQKTGSFLSTLEHECTHAIFAIMTFHGVTGLRVTWNSGGHVRYTGGEGNWLITISPYFVPTICIVLVLVSQFVPAEFLYGYQIFLGASVGFHLGSTYLETHESQHDLTKVGLPFCFAFLPTANLIVFTLLLAFIWNGKGGMLEIWDVIYTNFIRQIHWIELKI